jgi:hypothetical protein
MKLERHRIGRGVNLLQQHVFGPTAAAQAIAGDHHVSRDNLHKRAPFNISFCAPFIEGVLVAGSRDWNVDRNMRFTGWHHPFLLTPHQEHCAQQGVREEILQGIPVPELDEVMFSFDQRAEPGAITGPHYTVAGPGHPFDYGAGTLEDSGRINLTAATELGVRLALYEHDQLWFRDRYAVHTGRDFRIEKEVWSVDIPHEAFSNPIVRENPFVVTGIGLQLNPWKTYLFSIICDGLFYTVQEEAKHLALVSALVDLRFLIDLVPRDSGATVQNIPTDHYGVKRGWHRAPYHGPGAGQPIEANAEPEGVATQMRIAEEPAFYKLSGGYTWYGDQHPKGDTLHHDAHWFSLIVPMWGNQATAVLDLEGLGAFGTIGAAPYINDPSPYGFGPICDRRIIPLCYPITIHHVFALLNWQAFREDAMGCTTYPNPPIVENITMRVGVGIGCALQSDHIAYEQVAYTSMEYAYPVDGAYRFSLVDRVGHPGLPYRTDDELPIWDIKLVPLVTGAIQGTGYTAQGRPYWVGRTLSHLASRTQVGTIAPFNPRLPNTGGAEQFLEVRWQMEATGGVLEFGNIPGEGGERPTLVGYQGHAVQIIGKAHLI